MWSVLSNNRKKYEQLNLGTVLDYEKYNMISIIYHSTKIEGCALTETDTRVLLEKDITAKGKPLKDHLMVKDHYDALLYLKRVAEQKQLLSVELIKTTCSVLMKNTGEIIHSALGSVDTSKGELRQVQVYVDRKYFPDFSKVPALLDHLITKTNERLETVSDENDILCLAADVHYSLVNIHPFADGNGRLSRLFMNYILMYHQQPLVKIFSEDRAEYIDALNETEEKENPDIFRDFICNQQNKFFTHEIEKYANTTKGFNLLF